MNKGHSVKVQNEIIKYQEMHLQESINHPISKCLTSNDIQRLTSIKFLDMEVLLQRGKQQEIKSCDIWILVLYDSQVLLNRSSDMLASIIGI